MKAEQIKTNFDRFGQFFRGILRESNIEFPNEPLHSLFEQWRKCNKINSTFKQNLANLIKITPQNSEKVLPKLVSSKKMEQKIKLKINEIKQVQKEDQEILQEICLNLLNQRKVFDDTDLIQRLQQINISIENPYRFFKKLEKLIKIQAFAQFQVSAKKLLSEEYQIFQDFTPQEHETAVKLLYERNQTYEDCQHMLSYLGIDNPLAFIKQVTILDPNNSNDNFQQMDTEEQFVIRVKKFLFSNCAILKKRSPDDPTWEPKAKTLATKLYGEQKQKNIDKIKLVLKESNWPEFKYPEKISDQFLIQIYQLKSIDQLKQAAKKPQPQPQPVPVKQKIQAKEKQKNKINSEQKIPDLSNNADSDKNFSDEDDNGLPNHKRKNKVFSEFNFPNNDSNNSNSKKSQKNVNSPQDFGKNLKQQQKRIKTIEQELQLIKKHTKNTECIESVIRELELQFLHDNIPKMSKKCDRLIEMIKYYKLDETSIEKIKDLTAQHLKKQQKKPRIAQLRRKIQFLNLEEIIISKNHIKQVSQNCQNVNAIIEVGFTGVGKTTFIHGASGHTLAFASQTQDYRCTDPKIGAQFVIGDDMTSETTHCNYSRVPDSWLSEFGQQQIKIIDTPGLDDNRLGETDIKNNLGTINVLRKLKSGWIVIFISQRQFTDKGYDGLRKFIFLISNYLVNFDELQRSISFVLTKGLTQQMLLRKLKTFKASPMFTGTILSPKEKSFLSFLEQSIQSLPDQFVIQNPATHKFKMLIKSISKKSKAREPGMSITGSFSPSSLSLMANTAQHYKRIIQKIVEYGQYNLIQFYLYKAKELDEIAKTENHSQIIQTIKNDVETKVATFESCLNRFIEYNDPQTFSKMKEIQGLLIKSSSSSELQRILYNNKQDNPINYLKASLSKIFKQAQQKLQNPSSIKKDQRKKYLSYLKLIKEFKSQADYDQIKDRIQNQNTHILNEIHEILNQRTFDKQRWKQTIQKLYNQFTIDKVVVNQLQNYERVKSMVMKHYDSNPQDLQHIQKLIKDAETIELQGDLFKFVKKFMDKVKILPGNNFLLKEGLQQKTKKIYKSLKELITFFQNQKQQSYQNKDMIVVQKWSLYEENRKQVYQLLQQQFESLGNNRRYEDKFTIQALLKNLDDESQKLEKYFIEASKDLENINVIKIRQMLKNIYDLIKFMKVRKTVAQSKNKTQKQRKATQEIGQNIEKAQGIIQSIIQNQARICKSASIANDYSQNNKLIVCLVINRQFMQFQKFMDQTTKTKLTTIKTIIINKLKSPLQQIKKQNIEFIDMYDYKKLYKILNYFEQLDAKLTQLSTQAHNISFLPNFTDNPQIKDALNRSFIKIITDFQKFQSIIELSKFNEKNKNQKNKKVLYDKKNIFLKHLSYDLGCQAIEYVFSYNQVNRIIAKFENIRQVEEFRNQKQKKCDLKNILTQRMNFIKAQIVNQQFKSTIVKDQLQQINSQFQFFYDILNKTKDDREKFYFTDTQKQINKILARYLQDFKSALISAQNYYKEVTVPVNFNKLKQTIQHPGCSGQQNIVELKRLLESIRTQYNDHLIQLNVALDHDQKIPIKINVFLNIYEFMEICIGFKQFQCKLRQDLLQQGLQKLFKKLNQLFKKANDKIKKGIRIQSIKSEVEEYIGYEKRINVHPLLKQKYLMFRKKGQNLYSPLLQDWFGQEMENLQKNLKEKYIDKFQLDANLNLIYDSLQEQSQKKVISGALKFQQQKMDEIQDYMQDDVDNFNEKYNQRKSKLNLYPNDLRKQIITQIYEPIEKLKKQQDFQQQQQIKSLISKLNVTSLLSNYLKSIQKSNSSLKETIIRGLNTIFQKQTKSIDFQDIFQLNQNLKRNMDYFQNKTFKSKFQQDPNLIIIRNNYFESVKKSIEELSHAFKTKFKDFQTQLNDINQTDSFKLNKFKSTPKESVTFISKQLKQVKVYSSSFGQQISEVVKMIQNNIEQESGKLKNQLNQLQNTKQKILMKQEISLNSFIQNLRSSLICREICSCLVQFNELTKTHKIQKQTLNQVSQKVSLIKNILKQRYSEAERWDFEKSLYNDTSQKMIKRNQQISNNLKLVFNFSKVLFGQSQKQEIPENCLILIQAKNLDQFKAFERKTMDQIQSCFKTDENYYSERVRHYYNFLEIKEKTQLLAFPSDMRIGDELKTSLIDKFKSNTQKIYNFATNTSKINDFKKQIKNIADISIEEKSKIQVKTDAIKQEKATFIKDHEEKLQIQLKNIPEDQKKDEKIAAVKKTFQATKNSKFSDFETKIQKDSEQVKQQCNKKRQKFSKQIQNFVRKELISDLIINHRARSYFSCQQQIDAYPIKFQSLMIKIESNYGKKITNYMLKCLTEHQNPVSEKIIDDSCLFESKKALDFKELTKGQTFESILQQISEFDKKIEEKKNLIFNYQQYIKTYDSLLLEYKSSLDYETTKINIIDRTIKMGQQIKKSYFGKQYTNQDRHKLIAHIFAVWTILKSTSDEDGNVQFIHSPHGGQILAIFLLLEMNLKVPKKQIEKCMVQVSTGEGKSVILGILSAYLALVGFTVYEACYSFYLSQRDYKDFQNLFTNLKVENKIKYNVFFQICQGILDQNSEEPFTKKIHDFITNPKLLKRIGQFLNFTSFLPQKETKSSILLIDEADVFLNKDYLGQSYYPTISIKTQSFEQLLNQIWNLREKSVSLQPKEIIQMKQFKQVCTEIDNKIFRQIMQNQVHAMIRDLTSYKHDSYNVNPLNQRIYYKEGDGQSDKIHYGYRTIWAYFHECRINKKVSETNLRKQIFINLIIAGFSYSELPSYFSSILGVTGTLTCMSDGQKQILNSTFGVQKMYEQPSIYPKSNRQIYFKKCSNNMIHQEIVKNIEEERSKKRPIVVFFKSKLEIENFFESEQFAKYKSMAPMVTHDVDPKQRDFRIQFSTDESRITLVTVDFSRGTDFKLKIKDPKNVHPGLHIICTYLPESFSDYVQLAGRTGRQGKNGSVFIIIPSETQVPEDKRAISRKDAEKIIRQNDNNVWAQKLKQVKLKIQTAKTEHKNSVGLYSKGTTVDAIFQNIQKLNYEAPLTKCTLRSAICIDGTASMGHVLPKVIEVVNEALPNIYQMIRLQQLRATVELKLVIYRNYNSGAEKLLQFTNFQTQNIPLGKWLKKIQVDGGWGNEAIQVCFQHINSIENIHQCIIIGDAIANTAEDTVFKRKDCGKSEKYWNEKGYPPTNYDTEVKKLIQKNIKVHSYYLNPHGTSAFYKRLSEDTKGVSEEFKINHQDAIKMFTDFVADKIIRSLGELLGGDSKDRMMKTYAQVSKNNKKKYVG